MSEALVARNALVEQHAALVETIVSCLLRRKRIAGLEKEDLIQEGSIGLIDAATNFDPARGVTFATYAAKCIRTALCHALRAAGIRTSDDDFEEVALTESTAATPAADAQVDAKLLLENALPQLNPRRRAAVLLHAEGHSKAEISRRLECSERHAGRLIEQGHNDLRRIIGAI